MLTKAKLQVTAAISMLIVSIVLGLFLAVASWDIKEMVLSANVRSNAFVDMFQTHCFLHSHSKQIGRAHV